MFIILIFFSIFISWTEEVCLSKLEDKKKYISSLQDHGKLKQMHIECSKLLELLEKCDCFISDSVRNDYKLISFFFSIEYFENLNNIERKDSLMSIIGHVILEDTNVAAWANYAYLHYKIKYENDSQKALQAIKNAEKFISRETIPGGFEKGFTLLNRLKSNIYLKSNNNTLAKASLWSAFAYAKRADKIYDSLYHKSWGYAASVLSELLRLPEAQYSPSLVERCVNELVHSKADYYNKSRQHKIILSLFDFKELSSSQLKILLNSIVTKSEYKLDLDINLKASKYFASNALVDEAIKYYKVAKLNTNLTSFQSTELYLVKAHIDFSKKDWKSLTLSLSEWRKNIEITNNLDFSWYKSSFRLRIFQQIREASKLYLNTYEATQDIVYLTEAVNLYDQAINGIQVFKNEISTDEDRILLLEDLIAFSEQALNAYHHLSESEGLTNQVQYDNILNYFELNKSFNLLVNRSLTTDKFSLAELSLKSSYERKIASIEKQIGNEPELNDSLSYQLADYHSKLADLINSKQLRVEKLNLKDIQISLSDDQSIIEFFSGRINLFCLLINNKRVRFKKLGSDTIEGLNGTILLYQHLNKDLADEFNEENLFQYKKYSHDLYRLLIQPLQNELRKNVIIVADGNLATIAWPSLISYIDDSKNPSSWHFMIRDFNFNTQPSIALWMKLKKYVSEKNKFNFVAFAPEFSNLKFNIEEVKELARLFPFSKTFIKSNASKKNFYSYASESKMIHIASHANAGSVHENNFSVILLASDTIYANEIASTKFNSELAFLSACETGAGQVIHAEGVMSLGRAFFGAGVKSVISTLWEVNDKISKQQVIAVYNNLLKGQSKSEAIRTMQLDYISNVTRGQNALPYYWASYQCHGNTDAIFNTTSNSVFKLMSVLPILSFSFIGLTFYFLRKSIQRYQF